MRIWILSAALLLSGCEYSRPKAEGDLQPLRRAVSWAEVRQKVMKPSCMDCHATQNPDLSAYEPAVKAAAEIRKSVFVEHTMPKRGELSREQKQILLAWLDGGTPEGEPVPPDPDKPSGGGPVKATWAEVSKRVLEPACNSCHFPGNPKGISDTTDPNLVRASMGSIVGLSLSDLMPPPEDSRPLPPELKRILTEWWIAGMPD